jgi:hypothetical protein
MTHKVDIRTVEETRKDLLPFTYHLLQMEPRIRLYPVAGDMDEQKIFFCTKDHVYLPYQLPSIDHEIAHSVEMQDVRRWALPDWGLGGVPKQCFLETAKLPHLIVGAAREARVRALQHILDPSSQVANALNPHWEDALHRRAVGFGRFKSYQDIQTWLWGIRERTLKDYDRDRIEADWKTRLLHLQHWMETNANPS